MILRIGASEYEPSPEVKKFMLDERLKVTLNDARTTDLRDQIACSEELIALVDHG